MKAAHIYCLEFVTDSERAGDSPLYPWLEELALRYQISSVHQHFDDIERLEERLQTLFYEDRNFQHYQLLYLWAEGSGDGLQIGPYWYTWEELAELLEGKLAGKILHFGNTLMLDLDSEQIQYFLDLTRARGLSGYRHRLPVSSTILDAPYFAMAQEIDDVIELTENLLDKHANWATQLGFTMYYL